MADNIQPPVDGVVKVDPARPKQSHLFHVSQTLDESRTLNPSPVYIFLGLEPSAFPAELGGFPDGASPFAQPKSVVDRTGQTRSLLVPVLAGGGRFQVDPGLRSTFPVEDSQGTRSARSPCPGSW